MNKFKFYFYGLYLLYLGFTTFIAIFYENLVLYWDWDPINTWSGLLRYIISLGGVGLILVLAGTIIENIHIFIKNRKIKKLENEILELKSKLYDQSQSHPSGKGEETLFQNYKKEARDISEDDE